MIQTRYRRIGLAAVAVFFGIVTAVGTASAATPPDDPGRAGSAPAAGLQKNAVDDGGAVAGTPTATATDTVSAAASTATSDATVSASAAASAAASAPAGPAAASNGSSGFGAGQAANAGGNGGGQPCAGCVGNADGRTPKGQSVNDKNRGHACDDNKGAGRGNPAHSPCQATPPPTPDPTTDPDTLASTATVAAATATPSVQVLGVTFERPTEVLGVQLTRGAGLAFTGAATTPLIVTAIALLFMGAALLAISRRNKAELVRCVARLSGNVWIRAI